MLEHVSGERDSAMMEKNKVELDLQDCEVENEVIILYHVHNLLYNSHPPSLLSSPCLLLTLSLLPPPPSLSQVPE